MLRINNGFRQVLLSGASMLIVAGSNSTWAQDDDLKEVVVTASQVRLPGEFSGGQVARGGRAGMLGNLDIMDAPFSSTNYTSALILDQQAKSVADVLLNDPNVRVARGFGNFQEVYFIRGLPVFSDDMTYNGIYGILPRQFVAAEFIERVEVFRGANAFLNGAAPGGSGLGGAVNIVPKRARKEPLNRLTVGLEVPSQGYLALDFGRRFGTDQATGVRASVARRDGETSVANQERDLNVVSLGVDHQGERLRLSADIGYQDHHIDAPRPSVTPVAAIPRAPAADSNFALDWTFTDERQLFAVARGEYDVGKATTVWAAIGFRNGEEENVLANPDAQPNGATGAFRFDNTREDDITSADIGLRTEFMTGSVSHRLIFSASTFSIDSKNAFDFYFGANASNLYAPVRVPPTTAAGGVFRGGVLASPLKTFTTDTQSFAIADMISFADDRFLLTIGARDQTLEAESFDFTTGVRNGNYDQSKITPVGGIVFKPNDRFSIYANYIEGLVQGEVAPTVSGGMAVTNGGQIFDPYPTEQIEVGVKYDGGKFGATASVFNLSKPFSIIDNQTFSLGGEQENQGIEVSGYGELGDNVRLIGGLTWLDATLKRTQGGFNQGKTVVGAPDLQANFNVEFDVPAVSGLTFDARAIYTSSQFANAANTIEVPSWTRFDLGARYSRDVNGNAMSFRARIDNAFDSEEWISVGGFPGANYLVLGSPRTFVLSVSVDF